MRRTRKSFLYMAKRIFAKFDLTMKTFAIFLFLSVLTSTYAAELVIIGDSHSCDSFGSTLLNGFTSQGKDTVLYCTVSSAPQHWLKGINPKGQICQNRTSQNPALRPCKNGGRIPTLASILAEEKPSQVVVALGTNSLLDPTTDASYAALAASLHSVGAGCLWVGPPHLQPEHSKGFPPGRVATLEKNLSSFYPSLEHSVGSACSVIDSRPATTPTAPGYPTVDGVHRTPQAGKYWAEFVLSHANGTTP